MVNGGLNTVQVVMLKNWEQLDGKWYYFDDQGWMKENTWIQPDGNYYYLSASGAMVTGYQRVNGTPYFL